MLRSSGSFVIKLSHTTGPGTGFSLVIDECAASYALVLFLLRQGYQIIFLGKGILDDKIVRYMETVDDHTILVGFDRELDSRLSYSNSILLIGDMSIRENTHLINKFTESKLPVISN